MHFRFATALSAALLFALPALAGDLPDPKLTPGAIRDGVTVADLCPVAHTPKIRNVPESEKKKVFAEYGVTPKPGEYEVDHLVSLEIGGSNDIANLWPQSYVTEPWNAHVKDKLENRLHELVCAGTITLEEAQREISTDWIAAYRRYFSAPGAGAEAVSATASRDRSSRGD